MTHPEPDKEDLEKHNHAEDGTDSDPDHCVSCCHDQRKDIAKCEIHKHNDAVICASCHTELKSALASERSRYEKMEREMKEKISALEKENAIGKTEGER